MEAAFREADQICPGSVKYILVEGWTPGFNDGDPCEHSFNVVCPEDEPERYDEFWESLGLDQMKILGDSQRKYALHLTSFPTQPKHFRPILTENMALTGN